MQLCAKDLRVRGKLIRVGRIDGEHYQFLSDPVEAVQYLEASHRGIDIFTFVQSLSERVPRFLYRMEWDNLAVLEVSTYDNWITKQLDFKARNKVRKAEKRGVIVREVGFDIEFVRGIAKIYNETPIRQGRPFWHYRKDLQTVWKINATFMGRSIFIGAFLDGQLIGFIKMVANEDWSQAGLMQILSMIEHRDKATTNALIAQAVRSCADRGIRYLFYANYSFGNKKEDSLADFKRHNGFQKVEVPRYYVPLTIAGRIALQFNLQRRAIDWAPASMIAAYRKARSMFCKHGLKNSMGTGLEER
jgi:hypothetical protein